MAREEEENGGRVERSPSRRDSSRASPSKASSPALLLVEDDAALRRGLVEVLTGYGYDVLAAGSRSEAAEKLRSSSVEIVVTDLHIPGNGFGIVAEARTRTGATDIPVIMISADYEPAVVQEALDVGVSRFLVKPVTGGQLRDAIEAVLVERRRADLSQSAPRGGDRCD